MAAYTGASAGFERSSSVQILFGSEPSPSPPASIATQVLSEVTRYRRTAGSKPSCDGSACEICMVPHRTKVASAIARGLPITFVLPAFPGKSPNLAKVLGPLPDMAERRALEFLQSLCERIQAIYLPGARIVLCSDGRVFSDAVGMRDEDVTAYQDELSKMIRELRLTSISTFNLEELHVGRSFDQMRRKLMEQHGEPLESLWRASRHP